MRFLYVLVIGCCTLALAFTLQAAPMAGVVGTGTPASCSEAALDVALTNGGTISFNCGGPATINLSSDKILVSSTTIDGANQITLSGRNLNRLFVANGEIQFTLRNLTLEAGFSPVGGGALELVGAAVVLDRVHFNNHQATDQGGAIYCFEGSGGSLTIRNSSFAGNRSASGGAIYNDGCSLTIDNSDFTANSAPTNNITSFGGAIYSVGPTSINNTRFYQNQARDGGAIFIHNQASATIRFSNFLENSGGYGGALENTGGLTITDSLLQANTVSGTGGAIWNSGGRLLLKRSRLLGNQADEGGAISSYGSQAELVDLLIEGNMATGTNGGGGIFHENGTLFISNASLIRNVATAGHGGAIYQDSDDNLTLSNVTVAENQADQFGGGLYHKARYAVITNSTFYGNLALAGTELYEDSPLTSEQPGIIQIGNSVVAGASNNCGGSAVQSLGFNLSDGTCAGLDTASDQQNLSDLKLSGLQVNGGRIAMPVYTPLATSPLINAADPNLCPASDQRGAARVASCDVGAVEAAALLAQVYLPFAKR